MAPSIDTLTCIVQNDGQLPISNMRLSYVMSQMQWITVSKNSAAHLFLFRNLILEENTIELYALCPIDMRWHTVINSRFQWQR